MPDIQTLNISKDHTVAAGQAGETVTVTNLAGDTVYYGDRSVSASSNLGSLTAGQSVVVTVPQDWLLSASYSTVQLSGVANPSGDASSITGGSFANPLSATTTFLPLPTGVAATDTANLNTVLARGGRIRPNPLALTAAYSQTAPLVVPSNTDVDFGGCTITLTGQFNQLQNAVVTPAYTATDAATTAGSSVVVSPTLAAHAATGMVVGVVGAGPQGGDVSSGPNNIWMYGQVLSVSGNNITLTGNIAGVAATNTMTGATAYLFNRDTNISISGGNWNAANIWPTQVGRAAAGFNSHQIRLRRIDGLTVKNVTLTMQAWSTGKGWAFGINPDDVTDFTIDNCIGNGSSTVVQIDGPAARGRISNIRGYTQDDMVALGCLSFQGTDTEGDITDIQVDGIQSNGSWTAFKVFSGQGGNGVSRYLSGVTARSIKGTVQREVVNIIDYTGAGAGPIDCIVEDVSARSGGSGFPMVNVAAISGQTITLKNIKWDLNAPVATSGVINMAVGCYNLIVENLDIRGTAAGTYTGLLLGNGSGSNSASITLTGVTSPEAAATVDIVNLGSNRTIERLSINRVRKRSLGNVISNPNNVAGGEMHLAGGSQGIANGLLYSGGSGTRACTLRVSDFYGSGSAAVVTSHPLSVFFSNVEVTTTGAIVQATGANATPVGLAATNLFQLGGGALISRDGSQVLSASSLNVGVDASILSGDQNVVVNTNAGLSSGVGLVIYNAATGVWTRIGSGAGGELAYAQITANSSAVGPAVADITSLSVTFTAPLSGAVMLTAKAYSLGQGASAGTPSISITNSGNTEVDRSNGGALAGSGFSPAVVAMAKVTGLTAGTSYTYKVRGLTTASTMFVVAGATFPAFLRAVAA